jgi:hypothetical protein
MSDVYLVLLTFGPAHEQAALDLLLPMITRVCPDAAVRTVIVDNALDGESETAVDAACARIAGDNDMREFSGWDRGLEWVHRRHAPAKDALIVLANDTVVRPDKCQHVRDVPRESVAAARRGALVGWIEEYPRPATLFGRSFRQWVDTSLVLVAEGTLARLVPLARSLPGEVFGADGDAFFLEPSPLSENYRTYLRTYFFGERLDPDFVHAWYGQTPLTESNREAFKVKLRCVMQEHLLSATALTLGIPLADINPTPRRDR